MPSDKLKGKLKNIMTNDEFKEHPLSSFDVIGDIVVIELPEELEKKSKRIGSAFLEEIPNAKVVAKKKNKISGTKRIQKVEVIAGEKRTETLHKENGCRFKLDINKMYFSPRLGNERLRVSQQVGKNEIVYDFFCGIGPFAVQIAKKCKFVVANDINSDAVEYLKENIKLNKLTNVAAYNTNAAELTSDKHGKADRIIMNHPSESEKYLSTALKIAKRKAIIHFYTFAEKREDKAKYIEEKYSVKVKNIARCGEYSPAVERVCFDLIVK